MNKRDILRKKAKELYKQQAKGIPKKYRIPFADFFKTYVETIKNPKDTLGDDPAEDNEDFNFDELINMNELSDDDVLTPDPSIVEEEK